MPALVPALLYVNCQASLRCLCRSGERGDFAATAMGPCAILNRLSGAPLASGAGGGSRSSKECRPCAKVSTTTSTSSCRRRIRERINQFGGKLYLEFGGKLFDDYHASRVLPGFKPDTKISMLQSMKDEVEIVIAINANDIERLEGARGLGHHLR